MRLKHILFSSLFVSASFVACTNDDFVDLGSQVAVKDAISLGEGFTISGGFSEAQTRAIYQESTSGSTVSVKSLWEPNDTVGGAWYAALTQKAEGNTAAEGYLFANGEKNQIASNHPYTRVNKTGNLAIAEFETNTNSFAGKYALYYPYDAKLSATKDAVPVTIETAQTMDVANPLAHVSKKENFFAYTNKEYVDGGAQAENFELLPVPVLYRLAFRADETTRGLVGKTISMVIIETEEGDQLYSEGKLTVGETNTDGRNTYEKAEATYSGETATNIITLTVTGNEAATDYQVSAIGAAGGMKKPFYIVALPADDGITSLTFKVVTTDGKVFVKKVGELQSSSNDALREAVTSEGGYFNYNITLDEVGEDAEGAIYTPQQFENAWDAAVKSGKITTINLGAPLSIDELTLNETGANIKVTGKTLTVGTLTVTDGTLAVADLVAGDVEVEMYGNLTTKKTKVTGAIIVDGAATFEGVESLKSVSATRRSSLSITGAEAGKQITGAFNAAVQSEVTLKDITLAGTNTVNGAVTIANGGTVTFKGATTVATTGTIEGAATATKVEFTGALTNNGVVDNTNITTITFKKVTNAGAIAAANASGEMTFTDATVNTGTVEVVDGTVKNQGSFTNRGNLVIATGKTFNNGVSGKAAATLTLEANPVKWNNTEKVYEAGSDGTIKNLAGSTVKVAAADGVDKDNNSVLAELKITNEEGTIDVTLPSDLKEVTFASLDNDDTVKINKGKVNIAADAMDSNANKDAEIIVAATGKLDFGETAYENQIGGLIIVAKDGLVTGANTNDRIACYYADMAAADTDAKTVIINSDVTLGEAQLGVLSPENDAKDLIIRADITLKNDWTLKQDVEVEAEVLVSKSTAQGVAEEVIIDPSSSTVTVKDGSLLKIGSGVKYKSNEDNAPAGVVKVGGIISEN